MKDKKSDEQWREVLTDEQYYVCREKGTERPFTGEYNVFEKEGVFHCVCCQQQLFDSSVKFDAGCGWPSFYQAIDSEAVTLQEDSSLGMERTEVLCSNCGAHLGHVFPDGPEPSGLRYCINSVAMKFKDL
ncbi:peptide-methionine (R)-S-oxide reductase MsrB [Endozoicomonas sp. SCSIO W0465]|uniref:peptide-methionine (R)-S-oxide reductase MsrB n=1 Tax=Endozoicomonas sp. SCSIO W0465 TaxID=2918516 RepID=UPI002074D76C|nr:peptide-methionine (R)-S-oxide reductase MsrB [Endozoicomonas sp. SCSIO W0465]USE35671.1 peptide-methionine (R)-S-oxide reductase MsrB [Endozoicomonas sp. SCSIO W0465]